jgi:hypothetical protein
LLFGMLGAALFAAGVIAGLVAVVRLLVFGAGTRPVWTIIQTCLILGSVFFATGFLGELVAGLNAQARELRRRLDEVRTDLEDVRAEVGGAHDDRPDPDAAQPEDKR